MTYADWKPFDYRDKSTHPKTQAYYLVTIKFSSGERLVVSLPYYKKQQRFATYDGCIIAWAEQPEPYREQDVDMHPDAITARKYVDGDPETVKALHIFDKDEND